MSFVPPSMPARPTPSPLEPIPPPSRGRGPYIASAVIGLVVIILTAYGIDVCAMASAVGISLDACAKAPPVAPAQPSPTPASLPSMGDAGAK